MKKVLKFIGYFIVFLVVAGAGLISYGKTALPNVGPAPVLKVDNSVDRIERGRYLAHSVSLCVNCHSERDWTKFAGPIVAGTLGRGGEAFDRKFGFPGEYYSKNITPAGISRYSDGELFRVITTGVTKEGRALFPIMPYSHYAKMDPEDIKCIIAYIRTLAPVNNEVKPSVSDFPMNIIINMIPAKAVSSQKPDPSNVAAYGAYLVNASGCIECHTKENKGQIIPELAFSGGREFILPDGSGSVVRSSNITPDMNTGIGNWTQEAFVNRFKAYADSNYKPQPVSKGAFNTVMPWTSYGHMTREDLIAIYTYLHNLKPMENTVDKFTPAGRDR
jgi:mono/diheme cytochrome c family protein